MIDPHIYDWKTKDNYDPIGGPLKNTLIWSRHSRRGDHFVWKVVGIPEKERNNS